MKNFAKLSVYNVNSLKRSAAGFPLDKDGKSTAVCLDGKWKFKFVPSIDRIPQGYEADGVAPAGFDEIDVPSEWQIKGFDTPIYTNYMYPYALAQFNLLAVPKVKERKTSAGCYVTEFEFDGADRDVFLRFDGINCCGDIYVNGKFVGYSEDTFSPQEYDITSVVRKGSNKLAVTVYRYCTGSYLEDQDMWRLSGIFRSVWLIAKPHTEVIDCFSLSTLKNDYKDADFETTVTLASRKDEGASYEVKLTLTDGDKVVAELSETVGKLAVGNKDVKLTAALKDVKLWSDEYPNLYRVRIILLADGKEVDRREYDFGFREVRIQGMKDGRGPFILLNGRPIKIYGVNRHEFHPYHGHAVPHELIEKDLLLCKANNITAIRNSHYPNCDAFYEMCDRIGILVMAETNLESHGLAAFLPASSKKWVDQCVYRAMNMVERLKNHPCIISWSLGNEAGFGKDFFVMREAILARDTSRFIHYEPDQSGKVGDVLSEMYSHVEKMPIIGENKPMRHCLALWSPLGSKYTPDMYRDLPFIQCEYAHCMGNALGDFSDYWDMFRKYDRLAGGFIWDFADQAIHREIDGKDAWLYGGDFGDKPNAGRFAFNGIVRGDRSPNPALYEVKYQYAKAGFEYEDGKLTVTNRHNFTDLDEYETVVSYVAEGEELASKTSVVKCAPGEKAQVPLPEKCDFPEGKEVVLNVRLLTTKDMPYAKAGHVAATGQFVVKPFDFSAPVFTKGVQCTSVSGGWTITAGDVSYSLGSNGYITSAVAGGKELLSAPIRPNFARATIDNDALPQVPSIISTLFMGKDKGIRAQKRLRAKSVNVFENDGVVTAEICWSMPHTKHLKTTYTFSGDGSVRLAMSLNVKCSMERYGFTFRLAEGIDGVLLYGKGPHENYCDRATGAELGVWSGKAEEMIHDYLYPQENGNHTGVRYATIGDKEGVTLRAVGKPFEMTVHPYTYEMLQNAQHLHELGRENALTVCVDGKQRGVGGDTPAMACTKPQYDILPGKIHTLDFTLKFNA